MGQNTYVISDGELVRLSESRKIEFNSRALKYGDGFFETINFFNDKIYYLHLHLLRMQKTARLLKFDFPNHWNESYFETLISKLAKANKLNSGRINIIFSRDTSGYYLPADKMFRFHIAISETELRPQLYELAENGLKLGEYRELIKTSNYISNLKTSNGLLYVMASLFAKAQNVDECLIFNEFGRVAECISSNLILYKDGVLVTPPNSEYGIDGVMRKVILQKASAYGYKTEEYPIFPEDLFSADEVWLSNVMSGIKYIAEYRGKTFTNAVAKNMISVLNK